MSSVRSVFSDQTESNGDDSQDEEANEGFSPEHKEILRAEGEPRKRDVGLKGNLLVVADFTIRAWEHTFQFLESRGELPVISKSTFVCDGVKGIVATSDQLFGTANAMLRDRTSERHPDMFLKELGDVSRRDVEVRAESVYAQ